MALKLKSIQRDLGKERNGDWVEFPEWPGVAFKVKSLESPGYRAARDLVIRRLGNRSKGGEIPQDDMQREIGTLYHQQILLDWRGLDEAYSSERALEVLTDPAYRQLFAAVTWCAQQVGASDMEFVEDAAKNSGPRSEPA